MVSVDKLDPGKIAICIDCGEAITDCEGAVRTEDYYIRLSSEQAGPSLVYMRCIECETFVLGVLEEEFDQDLWEFYLSLLNGEPNKETNAREDQQ